MAFKVPSFDAQKLKHGLWGNTWKEWGKIMGAFLILYLIEAGYFTGLLFAAKKIRGDQYKSLTDKFFGDFDTAKISTQFPFRPTEDVFFNRPQGCKDQTRELLVGGGVYTQPNGIQACDTGVDGNQWVLFPWTLDTNALGTFPGCSNPQGASSTLSTFLSQPTSPAYYGNNVVADDAVQEEYVCQNFVSV